MLPRPLTLPLLALSLLLPVGASEDAAPYAPLAVAAFEGATAGALISWIPGEAPADSYRVYGVNPGAAPVRLHDTATQEAPGAVVTVPGGFQAYGVTGVVNGEESGLVLSYRFSGGTWEPCARAALQPEPYVFVCLPTSVVRVLPP